MLILSGACGPMGDLMRGRDEPPLPGERISVLTLEEKFVADPTLSISDIIIPLPIRNKDWPQAGGTPSHVMQNIYLPEAIKRVWGVSIGKGNSLSRKLTASPVVALGIIFSLDTNSKVTAFDVQSGKKLWEQFIVPEFEESGAIGGGVSFDQGILYVASAYGDVKALDARTGTINWSTSIGIPLRGAPTISSGRAFVLSHNNQLFALSTETGEVLWNHVGIQEAAGLVVGASTAVSNNTVVVPYTSGEIYALRPENGRVAWSDSLSRTGRLTAMSEVNDIAGLPVIDQNLAIIVGRGGRMAAIDIRSGIRMWEIDLTSVQSPWVAGNIIFSVSVNGEALAISRDDGRIYWVNQLQKFKNERKQEDSIYWLGPILAGERLIFVSSIGEIIFLDSKNGKLLKSIKIRDTISIAPILADGTLYILTDGAKLYAYR